MLVLDTGDGPVAVYPRLWDRISTWLRARQIDADLARGVSPDATTHLALRAEKLVQLRTRLSLAKGVYQVVKRAVDPASGPMAAVPVCRDRVVDASPDLLELARRLIDSGPVSVQGVAQAQVLLTDARGPLYFRESSDNLHDILRRAIDALDVVPAM